MRVPRNNLIITYKPDVLSMVEHNGSFKKKQTDNLYPHLWNNDIIGKTSRSEVETLRNIKSVEACEKIISRRNRKNIICAKYKGEVIIGK